MMESLTDQCDQERMRAWKAALPAGSQPQGLENMKRWQCGWENPCVQLCCFSSDCASQRCDVCFSSISKDKGDRAVCMECDVKFVEPGNPSNHDVVGFQMCKRCLLDASKLHDHSSFCLISGSDGTHKAVQRLCGIADRYKYTTDMCVKVSSVGPADMCMICYCEYDDADNPPCTWPGCKGSPPHAFDSVKDMKLASGVRMGNGYVHRDCLMQWIEMKQLSFCAMSPDFQPPPLCAVCEWDTEAFQWKSEFACCVAALRKAFDGNAALEETAAKELFDELCSNFEVGSIEGDMMKQSVPLRLPEALELLKDATARLHPQLAIQGIMNALCEEFTGSTP